MRHKIKNKYQEKKFIIVQHFFQAVIVVKLCKKHENVIDLCVFIGYINASYKICLKGIGLIQKCHEIL